MESQPSLSDFSAPLGMSAPAGAPETLAPELVSPPEPLGQDIQLPQALIAPVGAAPMAAADLTALIPEGIPGYERPQNPFEGWPFQAPEPPELPPLAVPEPLAPGQMSLEEAMAADARNRNDDRRSEDPRREQQEERTIELPRYQPGELGTLGDEFEPPTALQFAPEPDDDDDDDALPASADLPPPAEALADFTSADDPEVLPAEYLSQVPESPVAEAPGDTLENPLDPAEPSQPPEALSPPEEALQAYNALSPLPPTEQLFPSLATQEALVPPGSPLQAVPTAPELSGAGGAEGSGPSLGTGDPRSLFSLEESFAAEPGSAPLIAGNLNPLFPDDASAMVPPGGPGQEALPAVEPPDTSAQAFLSLEDRFVQEGFSLPDQLAAPELLPELLSPELLEAELPPPLDGLPTEAVDLAASPPTDNGEPLSGEAENLFTAVDPETAEPTMQPPILEAAADGTASPFAGYPPEPLTEAHGSPVGEGPIPPVDFFSAPDEGSLRSSVAEPSAQVDELESIGQPGMIPQPEPLGAQPQLREQAEPTVEPQLTAQPEPPAAEPTDLPHTPQAVEPQLIAQPEPLSADTVTPSERPEAEPSLPAAPAEIPFLEQTEPFYANESAPELPPAEGNSPVAQVEEVFPVPPLISQATDLAADFPLPVEPVMLTPSELPGEVTASEPLRATALSEGEAQRYVPSDDAGASEFSVGAPEFSAPSESESSFEAPGIDTPVEPLAEVAFLPTQDELADNEPVEFVEPLPHPEPRVQPEYGIAQDQPQQPTAPFADSQSEVSGSPPAPQVESRGELPGLPPQEQTAQVEPPQSADGMGLIDQPEAGSPSPVGDEELVLPSEAMAGSSLPESEPSAFEATSPPPSEAQIFQLDPAIQSQLVDGAPGGEVYGALLPESEIGEASSAISDRQAGPLADPAVPLREEPSVEPAIHSSTTESLSTGDLRETPEPPFVALEEQFSQEGLPEPVLLAAAEPFASVDTPVSSSLSDGELQAAIGDEPLPAAASYEAAGLAAQPLQMDMPTRLESSGEPVPPEGFVAQGDPSVLESLEPELSASLENRTPIGSDAVAVPQLSLREQPAAEPDPAVPLELPLDDETPAGQVAQAQTWLEELSGRTQPLSPLQPVELSGQSEPLLPFETQAPGEAPEGIFPLETETLDAAGGSDGPVASLEAVESIGEPEPLPVLEAEASELSEQPDTLLSPVTTELTDEPPSAGPPASPMGIPGDEPEIFAPQPAQTAAEVPEATVLSALQTPPAVEAWSGQPEAMLPLEGPDPQVSEFLESAGEPVFTSLEDQFSREQPPDSAPVAEVTAPPAQQLSQPQALGEVTVQTPELPPEPQAVADVPQQPGQPQAVAESAQLLEPQAVAELPERLVPSEPVLPAVAETPPVPARLQSAEEGEPAVVEPQPTAPPEPLAETELTTPLEPLSETASTDDAVSFAQLRTPGEFQSSEAPLQAIDGPIEPAADALEPESEVLALEERFAQEQGQPTSTISADGTTAVQGAPDTEVGFTEEITRTLPEVLDPVESVMPPAEPLLPAEEPVPAEVGVIGPSAEPAAQPEPQAVEPEVLISSGLPGEILTSAEETVAPSEASAAAGLETQPVAVPTPELATPVLDVSEGEFFSEPPFQGEQAELLPQPEPLPQSTPEASATQEASIPLEEPFVGEELPRPQPQVLPDVASAATPAGLLDPVESETELAAQPETPQAAELFVSDEVPDASSSPELSAALTAQAMPGGSAEAIRPEPPVTLEEASAAVEELGAEVPGEGLETPELTFAALEDQFSQERGLDSGVFTAEPPVASDDPSSNAELPLEALLRSELPAEFPVQLQSADDLPESVVPAETAIEQATAAQTAEAAVELFEPPLQEDPALFAALHLEAEAQELPLSPLSAFTELEERFAPEPTAELAAVAPELAAAAEPTSDDEIVVAAVVAAQPLEIPGGEPEAGLPLQPAELSGEPESLPSLELEAVEPSGEPETVESIGDGDLDPVLPPLAAVAEGGEAGIMPPLELAVAVEPFEPDTPSPSLDPQASEFLESAGEPVFTSLEDQFSREQPPDSAPVAEVTAPPAQQLSQPQALGEVTVQTPELPPEPQAVADVPQQPGQPQAVAESAQLLEPQAVAELPERLVPSEPVLPAIAETPPVPARLQSAEEGEPAVVEPPRPGQVDSAHTDAIVPQIVEPSGELPQPPMALRSEPFAEVLSDVPSVLDVQGEPRTMEPPPVEAQPPEALELLEQPQALGEGGLADGLELPVDESPERLDQPQALSEQTPLEQPERLGELELLEQPQPLSEERLGQLELLEQPEPLAQSAGESGLLLSAQALGEPDLLAVAQPLGELELLEQPEPLGEAQPMAPQEPLGESGSIAPELLIPQDAPVRGAFEENLLSLEEGFAERSAFPAATETAATEAVALEPGDIAAPSTGDLPPSVARSVEPSLPVFRPTPESSVESPPAELPADSITGKPTDPLQPTAPEAAYPELLLPERADGQAELADLPPAPTEVFSIPEAVPLEEPLATPEPPVAELPVQIEDATEPAGFAGEPPEIPPRPEELQDAEALPIAESEPVAADFAEGEETESADGPLAAGADATVEIGELAELVDGSPEPLGDAFALGVLPGLQSWPLGLLDPLGGTDHLGAGSSADLLLPSLVQDLTVLRSLVEAEDDLAATLPEGPELPTLAAIEPDLTPVDEVRAIEPDLPPLSEREIRPDRSEDRSTPDLTTLEALPVDGEAADDQPESPLGVARDLSVLRSLSEAALPLEADGIVSASPAFALPDEPGETTGIDPTRAAIDDTQEIPDADGVFDPAPEDGSVAAEGPLGVAEDLTVLRPLAGDGFSPTVAQDLGVLGLLGVAAGVFAAAGSEAIDPVEYGPLPYALAEQDPLDEAGGELEALLAPLDATVPEPFPPQLAADWPATSDADTVASRPLGMDVQPLGVSEVPALGLEAGVPLVSVADLQDFDADLLEADLEAPTLPTASERTLGQGPLLFAAQLLADQQPEEDAEAEPEVPSDNAALQSDFAQQEPDGFSGAGEDEMEVEPLVLQEYLLQLEARKNAEEEDEEEEADDGDSDLPTVAGEAAALSGAAFAPLLFAGSGALSDALGGVDHQIPDNLSDIEELLTVSATDIGLGTTLPADTGSSTSTGGGGGGGGAQEAASTYSGYMGDSMEQVLLSGQLPAHVPHPPPTEAAAQGNLEEAEEADVENADLEMLAQEIYGLLRQRLEVERERSGHHYLGRMPW
ncbi:hypothetical protein [Gloeobacter morelensis]|uniref:Uncharacterized protein n=1 Tax=Gloeobacter morelensis MG652769 TaxID=2781736 RepID=A0ABY3PP73_9CYAN|nr:hypothetical protein [Gloeobacter morelensis]UFP95457.1 hypothetical protein ISF26_04190 [Gloeobacter morelensis MG652769]